MSIQVFPLSEGVFTIGHDKIFHPFDINQDVLKDRPVGSLLVEIQPFLVQMDGINILLDTGLGFKLPNGDLQIHHNLAALGLAPNDIQLVLLSHLHKDHAGGISYQNDLNIHTLSFPNATYCISKLEFDYALQQGAPSYLTEDFELLKNSNQVDWLAQKGILQGNILYEQTGGHCPYHTSFMIHKGHEKYFFGGDVAPQLKQLKMRYVAKYDYDGKESMLLREQYALEGKQESWHFLFYHDVKHAIAQL